MRALLTLFLFSEDLLRVKKLNVRGTKSKFAGCLLLMKAAVTSLQF